MEQKRAEVTNAIDRHLGTMNLDELVMTLSFIHRLKDFREVRA